MRVKYKISLALILASLITTSFQGCGNPFAAHHSSSNSGTREPTVGAEFSAASKVINQRCVSCHKAGGSASFSPMDFTSESQFVSSGLIVPGNPAASKLIFRLKNFDQGSASLRNMPADGTLSDTEYRAVYAWVQRMGAEAGPYTCNDPNDVIGGLVANHARRLSVRQLRRTLYDLFGKFLSAGTANAIVDAALASNTLPADTAPRYKRWDNTFSSAHAQAYFDIADKIATSVSSTANYTNFVNGIINLRRGSCATLNTASPSLECQRQIIRNLGLRVLRRPLSENMTSNEVTDYQREFAASADSPTAVGNLVFRMLISPNFLFHLEVEENVFTGRDDVLKLSSYAIANRLSYTFWNTLPDEQLLSMAESADLYADEGYANALNYVLSKPAAFQDAVQEFFRDWLKLDSIPQFQTNAVSFATYAGNVNYTSALRSEMVKEVEELGGYLVANNATFKDIFTTHVSFARGTELMKLYGVTQAAPAQVTPQNAVQLPAGTRPGVLTRAALLLSSSGAKNPVMRGIRMRADILCLKTDPPPPTLPPDSLSAPAYDSNLTARERYDLKTSAASCKGCHSVINPLGYALSNYNGLGRFELTEPAFNADGSYANRQLTVEAHADLGAIVGPGAEAQNPSQYMSMIAERGEAKECFTQEFAKHFLARQPASQEGCRLNKLYKYVHESKSLKDFMQSLALDAEFRLRKMRDQ